MVTLTTTASICRKLGVTTMTMYQWQRGTAFRRPLPVLFKWQGKRRFTFYEISDVTEWLKQYRYDLLGLWLAEDNNGRNPSHRTSEQTLSF
jgi:hypothetical protein